MPDLQIVQIPEALSVGADYGLIVLEGAPEGAQALADYILSPDGQAVLAVAQEDSDALQHADPEVVDKLVANGCLCQVCFRRTHNVRHELAKCRTGAL